MKVTILGANGMLGQDLLAACRTRGIECSGHDLPEMDITRDDALDDLPACDWLVNCAAYTDVDGAESDPISAMAINRDGTARVAAWCADRNTPLLYISTDYIFDGTLERPYTEDDCPAPLNVYGKSKQAGERVVTAVCRRRLIVRTQSLFGVHGRSFVKAVISRLEEPDAELHVVRDQVSSPTYTVHLADAILRLLNADAQGIVNVSAAGEVTWYEFACRIAAAVRPGTEVVPVPSSDYPRPARRPAYSVLDKTRYEQLAGHKMPSWEAGLDEYLGELRT
ncbi:dTDP-4-dehydrorhamnose reductase [Verrucomicrobiota bacterium]